MTTEIKDMVTENLVEGVEYTVEVAEEAVEVAKKGGKYGPIIGLGVAVVAGGAALYYRAKTKQDDKPKKAKKAKKKLKLVWVEEPIEEEVTEEEIEVKIETEQK